MASISGTSSGSSVNSIYGTRNVISGLASGMDTESLIENAVSAYKMKINSLNQKRTKVEWQQEAYRSMHGKCMSSFLLDWAKEKAGYLLKDFLLGGVSLTNWY